MNGVRPSNEELSDLGFGARVTQTAKQRLLNRDGSFNVLRRKLPFFRSLSPYHFLLKISWTKFYLLVVASYMVFNMVFAAGYFAIGRGGLVGGEETTEEGRFTEDFFFSVQTSTTLGYGRVAPIGIASNVLASIEALAGLLGFALATSLMFARFSTPDARIMYSNHAIISPYRGIQGVMFRIANERSNQLIRVGVQVLLSRLEFTQAGSARRFHTLLLEREEVVFFPLTWTVVHPIDERSPLHALTEAEFRRSDPEILVLLTGVDETFSQTVYSRSSYKGDEIVWGAKFMDTFQQSPEGMLSVDLQKIHDFELVPRA